MLARIRKAQQNDESGFTLIELLVVIIIIGILAAIAIPTFLKQKEKGYRAAVVNDLKNLQLAEESWATSHDGAYTTAIADLTGASGEGVAITTGDAVSATGITAPSTTNNYCIVMSSTKFSDTYVMSQANPKPTIGTAANC